MIAGIDPGTYKSALVVLEADGAVYASSTLENPDILPYLRTAPVLPVIEMVENQGRMAVGKDTFETCVWIGRFIEAARMHAQRIGRRDVKLLLLGTARAKDSDIRAFLIDLYGGKQFAIGKKASRGPLYNVKGHEWQALAVAVAYKMRSEPGWKPGGVE
jgi:hypothetical protein